MLNRMIFAPFYRKMLFMTQRRFNNKLISAGSILNRVADKVFRRRGFGEGDVLIRWPDIVGPELAGHTVPEKLQRWRGDSAGAILHVRVSSAAALGIQHKTPIILERINTFYGYRAVDRLKLIQGILPEHGKNHDQVIRDLSLAESVALERDIALTKNVALRDALQRLGTSILSRRTKTPKTDDFGY